MKIVIHEFKKTIHAFHRRIRILHSPRERFHIHTMPVNHLPLFFIRFSNPFLGTASIPKKWTPFSAKHIVPLKTTRPEYRITAGLWERYVPSHGRYRFQLPLYLSSCIPHAVHESIITAIGTGASAGTTGHRGNPLDDVRIRGTHHKGHEGSRRKSRNKHSCTINFLYKTNPA